jgi:LuxR family maltose regulon positive regulatory protein
VEFAAALITAAEASRRAGREDLTEGEGRLAQAAAVLRQCADPGPVVRDWFAREQRARRETRGSVPTSPERLTEREVAVLALLPTPLSQRELAQNLFVSQNTMKTHLRAIYRKLGVESRDEAVLRARSLGLL